LASAGDPLELGNEFLITVCFSELDTKRPAIAAQSRFRVEI